MTAFLAAIVDFVSAHPHFAYAAVFLLALSEAMPIIGTVVPGSTLILGISALAPQGIVGLWPLLIAAISGAIAGDALSFWLGRRYHRGILLIWPLSRYPQFVSPSEAFFRRYGSFSVFLARFTPAVRAFVPLIAGIFQMRTDRFYLANVLSALVWAPLHVFPGVLVGALFSLAGAAAGRLAVLAIAVVILVWAIVVAVRLALRVGTRFLAAGQTRVWAWAASADNRLTFPPRSLLDPARNEAKILALLALALAAAAWIAFSALENTGGDLRVRTDAGVYHVFQSVRTYWGDAAMIAITELGATSVVVPLAAIVLLWLAWRRAWRIAAYWIAAVGFAAILSTVIEAALHRSRPGNVLPLGWSDYFPIGGDSTVNAVMYVFLAFLIARRFHRTGRLRASLAATAFVVLIALSRLYLGTHGLSEVTGGLVFGMAWIALLSVGYLSHQPARRQTRGLLVVACGTLALAGGLNIYRSHATDMQRYAVRREVPLLEKDWRSPEPWTAEGALAWLAGNIDPLSLPVIPHLESGRAPSLTMTRLRDDPGAPEARLVLRLWPSGFELRNGDSRPLWVGSVVEEHLGRFMALFTVVRTRPDVNSPRDFLAAAIGSGRLVARSAEQPANTWDGRILLAHDAEIAVK